MHTMVNFLRFTSCHPLWHSHCMLSFRIWDSFLARATTTYRTRRMVRYPLQQASNTGCWVSNTRVILRNQVPAAGSK
jgi:hypothetical protein